MAAIARRHGIVVTVSTLENWDSIECDLLYSAQSWHWSTRFEAPRSQRYQSVPAVDGLRSGTTRATSHSPWPTTASTRMLASDLLDQHASSHEDEFRATVSQGLESTGALGELVFDDVASTDHVTVSDAVGRLASHSHHRLLGPDLSAAIDEALQIELGARTEVLNLSCTARIYTPDPQVGPVSVERSCAGRHLRSLPLLDVLVASSDPVRCAGRIPHAMRIVRRMPRVQVYLPEDLHEQLKQRDLPASELLQVALRAELERQDALAEADRYLDELAAEVGEPSQRQQATADAIARRIRDRSLDRVG